jgi:hypothetical protein
MQSGIDPVARRAPTARAERQAKPPGSAAELDDADDHAAADADGSDDEPRLAPRRSDIPSAVVEKQMLDLPCIASIFDGVPNHPSTATLLFPVAYPPHSKKKDGAKRGTPQLINTVVHPPWPVGAPSVDAVAVGEATLAPPPGAAPVDSSSGDSRGVLAWKERAQLTPAAATATCHSVVACPCLTMLRLKRHNANLIPLYRVGPGAVAFRVVTMAFEANGSQYTPGGVFDFHVDTFAPVQLANGNNSPHTFEIPLEYRQRRPASVGWYVPPPAGPVSTACSFNVLWAKRADTSVHGHMNPYQRVNHFPGSWGIGRKDNLHKNVSRMRLLTSAADFDITPRTFLCPAEAVLLEADANESKKKRGGTEPTYIVKPVASSCGKGIRVVKGVPQCLRPTTAESPATAAAAVRESAAASKAFIVQQYVDPLLVDGRKFDLRMYVALTSIEPLRLYLFDQGLVRFAAERYPGEDKLLENTWAHLTNYAVNKTAQLRKESSHLDAADTEEPVDIKWMISDLRDHFLSTTRDNIPGPTPADVSVANGAGGKPTCRDIRVAQWNRVMSSCKDVIVKTILSIEADIRSQVAAQCRDPTGRGCFELFGFDLMIDSSLKPYVIEVNIMPSLATAESVDKAVKGRMLAHLLTLVGVTPYDRCEERRVPTEPVHREHGFSTTDPFSTNIKYSLGFLVQQSVKHSKRLKLLKDSPGVSHAEPTESEDYESSTDVAEAELLVGPPETSINSVDERNVSPPPVPDPAGAARTSDFTSRSATAYSSPQQRSGKAVIRKLKNKRLLDLASASVLNGLRMTHGAPLLHAPLPTGSARSQDTLSLSESRMLIESEEELQRSGGWERIFPTPATHRRYSHLFSEGVSRGNYVLASWEAAKEIIVAAAGAMPEASSRPGLAKVGKQD